MQMVSYHGVFVILESGMDGSINKDSLIMRILLPTSSLGMCDDCKYGCRRISAVPGGIFHDRFQFSSVRES